MRYCGSKRKFMKYLLPILTKDMTENDTFVDLFGGGMNVVCDIPCKNKYVFDNNKYVIALWNELKENGMVNIPKTVTEMKYNSVKRAYINGGDGYPDYVIGYVGICASFGSSWFNGYARFNPNRNEDHIKEAYNSLKKQVENFKNLDTTTFIYDSYENVEKYVDIDKAIIYCDPPYASTKKYESDFDNLKFWNWVREVSLFTRNMYISEYEAPADFKTIWEMQKKDSLGRKVGEKQNIKVEKLFVYGN